MDPFNKYFDIFISYNHKSQDIIEPFYTHLTQVHDLSVFYDKENMESGKELDPQMKDNILNSKIVIVFITIDYSKSKNCIFEYDWAEKAGKQIIPVMLDNTRTDQLGDLGIKLGNVLRITAYKELDAFKQQYGEKFVDLIKNIFIKLNKANYIIPKVGHTYVYYVLIIYFKVKIISIFKGICFVFVDNCFNHFFNFIFLSSSRQSN